jgi:hypothetical protein
MARVPGVNQSSVADLTDDLKLQEEFAQWTRLSDEAMDQFEQSL